MASEWTTVRAADFIEFNPRLSIKKGALATKVAMDKLQPFLVPEYLHLPDGLPKFHH